MKVCKAGEVALRMGLNIQDLLELSGGHQNIMFDYRGNHSVLRVSSWNRRSTDELLAEQKWLEHLSEAGVWINKPKAFPDGERIREIKLDGLRFLVTQFEKVNGVAVNPEIKSHWNSEMFREWGRVTGKLHSVSKTLDQSWFGHKAIISKGKAQEDKLNGELRERDREIGEKYGELLEEIAGLHQTKDSYGLIHGDLHHGNLLYSKGELHLIDADDFKYSWFAEDIAASLYHVHWHGRSIHPDWEGLVEEFFKAFTEEYKSENVLPGGLTDAIPLFLRKREFFLYNLFLKKWDTENLEVWQSHTLQKLENNLRSRRVPF
ncbi:phosphotransferase [Rossellomorea vietnamensis]|uniref:Phosphotransferase n=1 Tax=Rossellomorea vietnamensis TaxID=218284 RepID=A0A5D4MEZ2_9BACI|nr:phosphotransferase [Rossellomorea vietnamensis]TYR99893.1 phosphotransferase [Rossellomorea vietnamensis]